MTGYGVQRGECEEIQKGLIDLEQDEEETGSTRLAVGNRTRLTKPQSLPQAVRMHDETAPSSGNEACPPQRPKLVQASAMGIES